MELYCEAVKYEHNGKSLYVQVSILFYLKCRQNSSANPQIFCPLSKHSRHFATVRSGISLELSRFTATGLRRRANTFAHSDGFVDRRRTEMFPFLTTVTDRQYMTGDELSVDYRCMSSVGHRREFMTDNCVVAHKTHTLDEEPASTSYVDY